MNVVVLVGNLATDPELRHTANSKPVCSFRLAVSRPNGTDADFFTVVAWDRQAQICKEYLAVGRRVAVQGRLHHSTWEVEGADGEAKQRRSKVEVVAHRVELLGKPRRTEEDVEFAPALDAAEPDAAPAASAPDREFSFT